MRKISLLLMICLVVLMACVYQEPVIIEEPPLKREPGPIVKSPRYPHPYSDQFVLKVFNGLAYRVNVNLSSEEIVGLAPGSQADIPFLKSYHSRQVVLTGVVLSEEKEVIGATGPKKVRVPSQEKVSAVEEIWYITSFRRLRQ